MFIEKKEEMNILESNKLIAIYMGRRQRKNGIQYAFEKPIYEFHKTDAIMKESSLVHRDYHQKNVLFKEGHVSGVLDLEGISPGKRIYDLAFAIHEFNSIYEKEDGIFQFQGINIEKAKNFLNAYQETFPIAGPVKDLIMLTTAYRLVNRVNFELKKGLNAEESFLLEISKTIKRLPDAYVDLTQGE